MMGRVALLVDPPAWPAHGRLWSHLVSDTSVTELHIFAAGLGVPRQAFDRDHYDVPAEAYEAIVAAGASPVDSRELVRRLAAAGLRARRVQTTGRRKPGQVLLRPPRLRAGSLVAVVSPAGPVLTERLERGLAVLRGWGLQVRLGPHVLARHRSLDHLAGGDAERAADVETAWIDQDVAAVWCARGGYGSHRLVDRLEHTAMAAAAPRLLVGFSDVTALHELVNGRLGLVSLHAPVVTSLGEAAPQAVDHVRRLLFEPAHALELFAGVRLRSLVGGAAAGVLAGGNLRLLTSALGTRTSRPARGAIVVLEDIGEEPYRIDAMLTQLRRNGWFDGVRGIVAGSFGGVDATSLDHVLRDRLDDLGVPVVAGAPFGHIDDNRPVPLGVSAALDADAGSLRLARPALA